MKYLVLLIIAILLLVTLGPFGIVTSLVLLFIKDSRERYTKITDYFFALAYCIDILGNVTCGDLFNITLIKHGGYRFGKRGETISSVLGKNIQTNSLTKTGIYLSRILDKIDPNHCIKSIQQE